METMFKLMIISFDTIINDHFSQKLKGVFGWPVSITQFFVFITHNSKMVGSIARSPFGTTNTLFPSLNSLIFEW